MSKGKNIRPEADLNKNFIAVARVSKLFGTGGEVVLNLYDTFPRDYEDGLDRVHNTSRGKCDVGPQPKISYGKSIGKPQSKTLQCSDIEPLFGLIDGLRVPFYPESFRRRGQSGALAEFADIDTPQRAAELVGMELSIEYERNDTDVTGAGGDGIYPKDMVGFTVRFTEDSFTGSGLDVDGLTGTITGYIDSEHNPLFTLLVNGAEVFVPAADGMIASLDPDLREVTFDLPEGLLELYLS